jgi:hypothetical protein
MTNNNESYVKQMESIAHLVKLLDQRITQFSNQRDNQLIELKDKLFVVNNNNIILKSNRYQLNSSMNSLQKSNEELVKSNENLNKSVIDVKLQYKTLSDSYKQIKKQNQILNQNKSIIESKLKQSLNENQLLKNKLQNAILQNQSINNQFKEIMRQSEDLIKRFDETKCGQTLDLKSISDSKIKIKKEIDENENMDSIAVENIVLNGISSLGSIKLEKFESITDQTIHNLQKLILSFKLFLNNYQNLKNDKQIAVKEKENLFKRLHESMAKHNKCVSELDSTKERMVCFNKFDLI